MMPSGAVRAVRACVRIVAVMMFIVLSGSLGRAFLADAAALRLACL